MIQTKEKSSKRVRKQVINTYGLVVSMWKVSPIKEVPGTHKSPTTFKKQRSTEWKDWDEILMKSSMINQIPIEKTDRKIEERYRKSTFDFKLFSDVVF